MNTSPTQTRRNTLIQLASLAMAALPALPGCRESVQPEHGINLSDIPKLLQLSQDTATITKVVDCHSPKYAVIIVSDVHYNREQLDLYPEKEVEVRKMQGMVRDVLLDLISKLRIDKVYRDSHDESAVANCLASFKYLRSALADPLYASNLRDKSIHPKILALKSSSDPLERETATLFGNILGVYDLVNADAVMGLVYEGRLNLMPTEDSSLTNQSTALASSDPNVLTNPAWIALSAEREDYALRQSLKDSDRIKVLVFGHSHSFSESVIRHNHLNPNAQVVLYSIVPSGQQEFVNNLFK